MNVKLLSPTAQLPRRADDGAAGYDLYSSVDAVVQGRSRQLIKTDIALEIPTGCYGRIASRSSMGVKGLDIGAGVVDSSFRGEIKVLIVNATDEPFSISVGDRIAQLIIEKCFAFELHVVDELSDTTRGEGGFGSTGV